MKKIYKIIIADNNKFFTDALKIFLEHSKNFKIIATCNTINETIIQTTNNNFDLLILDFSFNGEKSLDYIHQIRPNNTSFKIICLTNFNKYRVKDKAITNDIDLYMGKDTDLIDFPEAIIDLLINSPHNNNVDNRKTQHDLTPRQIEIIKACYELSTEKEIANHLGISINTLKTHKQHLFNKTSAKNNLELIKYGIKEGIIIT